MDQQVKITVKVLTTIEEYEGQFLARCPILNVVTQGKTKEQARKHLKEEIFFLFKVCLESGTLEEVLNKRMNGKQFPPDQFVLIEKEYLDLPSDIPSHLLQRFNDAALAAH